MLLNVVVNCSDGNLRDCLRYVPPGHECQADAMVKYFVKKVNENIKTQSDTMYWWHEYNYLTLP